MILPLAACAWLVVGAPVAAPQTPVLTVAADPGADHRARLEIGPVMDEPALGRALRAGLPVRLRVRVELWRDGFFDELAGDESRTIVVLYEPLGHGYIVSTTASESVSRRYASYEAASAAVEGLYTFALQPQREGRYYYTASLEVETLSLSDLEELEKWLHGELRPAVGGEGSVAGAVGEGVKRLLIRMLRLPAQHYETRSEQFRVEPVAHRSNPESPGSLVRILHPVAGMRSEP